MAFWGAELKPGEPFTHAPLNRRLHLSLATLGMGDGVGRSIVQCNVGIKKALYLCSLLPEKSECCQINVEFEESDEVVFSVIGSRAVHLAGYYLSSSSLIHQDDDKSESYGEDIGESESEKSSDESEYGGSFIDDDEDEPLVLSSPAGSESNEEMPCVRKVRRRRLRKKYRDDVESENGETLKDIVSGVVAGLKQEAVDSEVEDTLPISSFAFRKRPSKTGISDVKETDNLDNDEIEDNATKLEETNVVMSPELNDNKIEENATKVDETNVVVCSELNDNKIEENATKLDETNVVLCSELNDNKIEENATKLDDTNVVVCSELNDNKIEENATMLDVTNAVISPELNDSKIEANATKLEVTNDVICSEFNDSKVEANATKLEVTNAVICSDLNDSKVEDNAATMLEETNVLISPELNNDEIEVNATMNVEINPEPECQLDTKDGAKKRKRNQDLEGNTLKDNLTKVTEDVHTVNDNSSRKKKKKRRCKNKEGDAMNTEEQSVLEVEGKSPNNKEIQLMNGIIMEELEIGKPDGKKASLGKKVRVHYTAKLKETGEIIDSSVGKAHLKFRLGGEKVQELWNVGIDGMQVGGKRRLTIPPSVSYTSDGTSEPNSWMVLDIELIKVR